MDDGNFLLTLTPSIFCAGDAVNFSPEWSVNLFVRKRAWWRSPCPRLRAAAAVRETTKTMTWRTNCSRSCTRPPAGMKKTVTFEKSFDKDTFPNKAIRELFIKYNTPIPSSAAVERMFPMGKDVLRPKAVE
ncbi:hypothetical protein Hamer_G010681 [Homarus americanus]|uniref:Uncharacterized protein n=1 Tax=Homarus americanus TaxID=6706 RepID=A0A8J5JCQ4_HOMAM|nr:hypothetical protein Hamer_G010681 [Homarus americanus]